VRSRPPGHWHGDAQRPAFTDCRCSCARLNSMGQPPIGAGPSYTRRRGRRAGCEFGPRLLGWKPAAGPSGSRGLAARDAAHARPARCNVGPRRRPRVTGREEPRGRPSIVRVVTAFRPCHAHVKIGPDSRARLSRPRRRAGPSEEGARVRRLPNSGTGSGGCQTAPLHDSVRPGPSRDDQSSWVLGSPPRTAGAARHDTSSRALSGPGAGVRRG
jgi:hypothetical protein